jgi:myosin protein heavy chain
MAPKKSRTQRESEPPADQPARQTRGTKRRQSDASNASIQSHAVQQELAAAAPAKRRKQTKAAVEPVIEVDESSIATSHAVASHTTSQDIDHFQSTQSSSKGVHFDEVESDSELTRTTASHITPHPRKTFALKRRVTTSVGPVKSFAKHVEVKTSRQSLPPSLSQQDGAFDVEEMTLQYAPYEEVLQPRMERLARLESLANEYRLKQDMGDSAGARSIREQISKLMPEHHETIDVDEYLEATARGAGLAVLASQEITYPRLQIDERHEEHALTTSSFSRSTSNRIESFPESERRKLQDAILSLSTEAEKAREEKKLLEQELIGLGLAADDLEDPQLALMSIRQTFAEIRQGLEETLPGAVEESYSNVDLIRILMANVKEFANRLRQQDKVIQDRTSIIDDLGRQINGLLDLLASAKTREEKLELELHLLEERVHNLNKRFVDVDQANENKERENEDLQEQLQAVEEERDDLDSKLQLKIQESKNFYNENLEYAKNIVRLNDSLKDYQAEKSRLELFIISAEEESNARQARIEELSSRINDINSDLESEKAELLRVTALYDAERQALETTEESLQNKAEEVNDLEGRVQKLEEELDQHASDLAELRRVNVAERQQREEAEAELDQRGEEIQSLNDKLEAKGIEANQLRQKLFEIQQAHKTQITTLENDVAEREEKLRADYAKEVARGEDLEDQNNGHLQTIAGLEDRIAALDTDLAAMIVERDNAIAALHRDMLIQREIEARLRIDLEEAMLSKDGVARERDQLKEQLGENILALQKTIVAHNNAIAILEKEADDTATLHNSEMEDFRSRIADLNSDVDQYKNEIERLGLVKNGLERRIEDEARETLLLQSKKDQSIQALEQEIVGRDQRITLIIEQGKDAERRHRAQLEEREEEIAALQSSGQSHEQTITTLQMNFSAMKEKFADYVRRSQVRFANLTDAVNAAKKVADDESLEQDNDSAQIIGEIDAMVDIGEISITTKTASTESHSEGFKPAGRKMRVKKKRVQDSGFYEADGDDAVAL